MLYLVLLFFCLASTFQLLDKSVVSGVVASHPRRLPSVFIAHRVQHSHCSSIFIEMLLNHALALSASQIVHEKKSIRIYTNMHSGGLEVTQLTYDRHEDNLLRHRGDIPTAGLSHSQDRPHTVTVWCVPSSYIRPVSRVSIAWKGGCRSVRFL